MRTLQIEPLKHSTASTRCSIGDYLVRWAAPRVAFCYGARLDPERLANAFARVLSDYSLYAGRIAMRDGWMWIDRGCASVPLELAESERSFAELMTEANRTHGKSITPTLPLAACLRGKGPLFGARLTQTPEGSVLSFTFHHSSGDFASALLLMAAWASAYREQEYLAPIDLDDREAFLAQHVPEVPNAASELRMPSVREFFRLVRASFGGCERVLLTFSPEELAVMQAAVPGSVTVDDALLARVFHLVHELRGSRESAYVVRTMNIRKRLGLPDHVLGNLVGLVGHEVQPGQSPAEIALGLRDAVKRPVGEIFTYHATQRFVEAHPRRWQRFFFMPVLLDIVRGNLLASTTARFPYGEVTFEPGAPIVHMFGSLGDNPVFSTLAGDAPKPGGLGREIAVCLPRTLARAIASPEARTRLLVSEPSVATLRAPNLQPQA